MHRGQRQTPARRAASWRANCESEHYRTTIRATVRCQTFPADWERRVFQNALLGRARRSAATRGRKTSAMHASPNRMPCHCGMLRRSAKKLPPWRFGDAVLRTTVSVAKAVLRRFESVSASLARSCSCPSGRVQNELLLFRREHFDFHAAILGLVFRIVRIGRHFPTLAVGAMRLGSILNLFTSASRPSWPGSSSTLSPSISGTCPRRELSVCPSTMIRAAPNWPASLADFFQHVIDIWIVQHFDNFSVDSSRFIFLCKSQSLGKN